MTWFKDTLVARGIGHPRVLIATFGLGIARVEGDDVSSLREQILVNLATVLGSVIDEDDRVHRTRRMPHVKDDLPAILILPRSETVNGDRPGQYSARVLSVDVRVYARGDIADQSADDVCVATHSAIMADETRGGVAMRTAPTDTSWRFDDEDQDVVQVTMSYDILYNARRASLDTRP